MKTLLILLMLLIAVPAISHAKKNPKKLGSTYLPFSPKGKYGKLPTKKAKLKYRKESWCYRQFGR